MFKLQITGREVRWLRFIVGFFMLGAASTALCDQATVYTWTDAHGIVHFSDRAQVARAKPAHLNLPTFGPSASSQASSSSGAVSAGTQGEKQTSDSHTPRILMPLPGATIENPQNKAVISVAIGDDQSLAPGETLVYRLDGQVLNKAPPTATRLAIDHLAPGRHQVDVMLKLHGEDTGREDSVVFTIESNGSSTSAKKNPAPERSGQQPR